MKNRFNLNEEEKKQIRNLYGIGVIVEQDDDDYDFGSHPRKYSPPPSDETWPFTMERYEFENKVPGGTGLPEKCDKCLMATIPEQYLDRDKRFGVFKAIVKLIVQVSGSRYNLTGAKGTEDQFGNKLSTDTVSTWEKPIIKLSDITDILKDFSPLGIFKIGRELFKCATNECSPKKIHDYRVKTVKGYDISVLGKYGNSLQGKE